MDVRWLNAPEGEVEAAIADLDEESRPKVPRRRSVLELVFLALFAVFFGVIWFVFGGRIDPAAQPRIQPNAVRDLIISLAVFSLLAYGAKRLTAWVDRPRRSDQLPVWRTHLTALANGVESEPVGRARFASLITGPDRTARCNPRYVGPQLEFGNLLSRREHSLEWHYLMTTLPAPLPHLLLESSGAADLPREFARAGIGQRLPLAGPFGRGFEVYAPRGYERDALFVFTPAVMATLLDHAAEYHLEITGNTLIFFTADLADFTAPEVWHRTGAVLREVAPALARRAERYRDQRVPGQQAAERVDAIRSAMASPGPAWQEPVPQVAATGRRLRRGRRRVRWSRVRDVVRGFAQLYLIVALSLFVFFAFGFAILRLVSAFT